MVTQGGEEYVPSMCPVHEYVPSTSLEDNQTKVPTLAESKEADQLKMNGNNYIKLRHNTVVKSSGCCPHLVYISLGPMQFAACSGDRY